MQNKIKLMPAAVEIGNVREYLTLGCERRQAAATHTRVTLTVAHLADIEIALRQGAGTVEIEVDNIARRIKLDRVIGATLDIATTEPGNVIRKFEQNVALTFEGKPLQFKAVRKLPDSAIVEHLTARTRIEGHAADKLVILATATDSLNEEIRNQTTDCRCPLIKVGASEAPEPVTIPHLGIGGLTASNLTPETVTQESHSSPVSVAPTLRLLDALARVDAADKAMHELEPGSQERKLAYIKREEAQLNADIQAMYNAASNIEKHGNQERFVTALQACAFRVNVTRENLNNLNKVREAAPRNQSDPMLHNLRGDERAAEHWLSVDIGNLSRLVDSIDTYGTLRKRRSELLTRARNVVQSTAKLEAARESVKNHEQAHGLAAD